MASRGDATPDDTHRLRRPFVFTQEFAKTSREVQIPSTSVGATVHTRRAAIDADNNIFRRGRGDHDEDRLSRMVWSVGGGAAGIDVDLARSRASGHDAGHSRR